jgi:hypothetical protein
MAAHEVTAIVTHHDGVLMAAGDRDYSGSTLNEDLARIGAIHEHSEREGWGPFPYHKIVSPNGRVFLTRDTLRQAAHVWGRNHESAAVCFMGDFTTSEPGDVQVCAGAVAMVITLLELGYFLPLPGHGEFALAGHGSECPGATFSAWQRRLWAYMGMQVRRVDRD